MVELKHFFSVSDFRNRIKVSYLHVLFCLSEMTRKTSRLETFGKKRNIDARNEEEKKRPGQ